MLKSKINSHAVPVYSTEGGRLCPRCHKPVASCICKQQPASKDDPPSGIAGLRVMKHLGVVRVSRETKGRGGKSVNVISGLAVAPAELEKLCTQLKKRCGTGGTTKDGTIEIQGEHRDTLVAELSKLGYTVKKAGG